MASRSKVSTSGASTKSPRKGVKPARKQKNSEVTDSDESEVEYDSDALDDDEDPSTKKRKRKNSAGLGKKTRASKKIKPVETDEEEFDLQDGQEVIGVVVKAPETGQVPPGQISQNTMNFLMQLKDPECNDREWFKLHDPVYRQAEQEWKDFIEVFTEALIEVDGQIPPLPPKDAIHRIYRDTRFSNDKTPYKQNFSASFSRSGRKGIFAFCESDPPCIAYSKCKRMGPRC
ncbi:hypothetical protein B0H15DRAFT_146125 [Mycena belliarum]|uniref:Uncharacterized protein n=1 Tax=Mycena belliarum TaxID=1033014 RepID=A0AAD6U7J5_9AGAR|nr:hypothetical protein B0H15DRAFT_146125 [Mycena belliae]